MHVPVLLEEVLQYLKPCAGENFIDCTINGGGHAVAILEKNKPNGKLLGIELDSEIYQALNSRITEFSERLILVNDSYGNLKDIVEKNNFGPVNGILLDLGMSTWHTRESGRGFSFMRDEPLIMRYGGTGLTAEEIINNWPEEKIIFILQEYGEERFAKNIARNIVAARKIKPINTTFQLVEIIKKSVPARYLHGKIHPATRTFQALRIAVNDELGNLEKVLPQTVDILASGGRLAIISFHSLEDRIVKNFFKDKAREGLLKIATKKPLTPRAEEIRANPASRSAKLRVAIKT